MPNEFKPIRRFNEIIDRIEQVRTYLGLNRSKFCRAIGMSPQTYNNFIGPQGTKPNIQLLYGVVTRFRANPMWVFTGKGNMFLTGNDAASTVQMMAEPGMAEGATGVAEEFSEELTGLMPTLRKIEDLLSRMDAENAPLLARFSNVFRRYLELQPQEGAAEIAGFLESVERKLAGLVEARSGSSAPQRQA